MPPSAAASLTRSSLLLICFLVVHLLGNLSALAGAGAFNGYADAMARNPLLQLWSVSLLDQDHGWRARGGGGRAWAGVLP